MIKNIKLLLPLSIIGKYSLLMWFLHSVFFNVSKAYTQTILYYPHNPILVVLWGLIICLAVAFVISFPINWLNKAKNSVFKLWEKLDKKKISQSNAWQTEALIFFKWNHQRRLFEHYISLFHCCFYVIDPEGMRLRNAFLVLIGQEQDQKLNENQI